MKKNFTLFIFLIISIIGFSQQATEYIYLQNGSIIKGIVLEQIPDKTIKVQTSDGSIWVFNMSEIIKITKENNETSAINLTDEFLLKNQHSKLERRGSHLVINQTPLTNTQLLQLVGIENLHTYTSARKQLKTGRTLFTIGLASIGGAIGSVLLYAESMDEYYISAMYAMATAADITICLGSIFKGIGKARINWVAENYNKEKNLSFNVVPSIINTKYQSIGAGLSLQYKF